MEYRNSLEEKTFIKDHHTAGVKVLQTDGSTYNYGLAVYNNSKIEATFDNSVNTFDNRKGLANYNGTLNNNNTNSSDKSINKITTGGYAHSYLLTSVISSDYEDIDNNGLTTNDLGSYTKFEYNDPIKDYKWRVPFEKNKVSHNNGLFSKIMTKKGIIFMEQKNSFMLKELLLKPTLLFLI
ncbi:MAG: hypothetical protein HC854_13420 [Flavobacterium sp.]|nr:hypothetical protein [Flavobacterium sp.]